MAKKLHKQEQEAGEKSALPKLAYSMRDAAIVLGVSYITMHRLIKRGLIRSSSALRTKVIPHSELERFLAELPAL